MSIIPRGLPARGRGRRPPHAGVRAAGAVPIRAALASRLYTVKISVAEHGRAGYKVGAMADGDEDQLRWWLGLRLVRGVGPVVYQGLLRAFGTPQAVFAASVHALECAGVRPEVARAIHAFADWAAVDAQLERLARSAAALLTWNDPAYPANLRQIHDPPPFLFVRGALQPGDRLAVAVVGSRNVGAYGLRMTRELSEGLARRGVTVVSGLARGTDGAAHWAALRAGGRTLAVIGSGIDVVYPSEHHALFQAIVDHGAVVTELLMGAQPDAENFPARNRIISGLSLGTVVVEAAAKSGSLITAMQAAEQGRDVFAVPGPVGERSRGTHRLLREGAMLAERAEDILAEIAPHMLDRPVPAAPVVLDAAECALLEHLLPDPLHVDALISRSGLPAATVLQTLLGLELKGAVQQLPGKHFVATVVDVRPNLAKE
jgi:DNA processing protein